MPSLMRFLFVLGVIFGIGYGALWALASLVEPDMRTVSFTIPQDRFAK